MRCECCEQREAHPGCEPYCEICARPAACDRCGNQLSESDISDWTPGSTAESLCESCRERGAREDAVEALKTQVERLAEKHRWQRDGQWHRAETGSQYIELVRDTDDDEPCETLKIRVSDHGTAHCSEDISLVIAGRGNPDDHDVAALEARLQRGRA